MAALVDHVSEALRGLTMKELRTQCRARSLNPAGNQEALKQRLDEAMRATGDWSIVAEAPKAEEAEDDYKFSSNYYQRPGGAQNLGNKITDTKSVRVSAPPGGISQVVFGDQAPAAPKPPSVAGALAGEIVAPSSKVPPGGYKGLSQVSFGDHQLPSYTAQNPVAAAPVKTTAERAQEVLAVDVDKMLKQLMLKDLRNQCRARNLNPAGGPEQLRQRLTEHMVATGDMSLVDGGESGALSGAGPQPAPPSIAYSGPVVQQGLSDLQANNNYHRPAGQNVGNYITGRNSSRVLAPPGGRTTIQLG